MLQICSSVMHLCNWLLQFCVSLNLENWTQLQFNSYCAEQLCVTSIVSIERRSTQYMVDQVQENFAKYTVMEALMGEGRYICCNGPIPIQELCGILSQYDESTTEETVESLVNIGGSSVEYADDDQLSVVLTSKSMAQSYHDYLLSKLPI